MKCPQCQTENPEDNRFCRECGAKIVLACPDCKAEISPGDKFCGKCGHSLLEPAEAPSVDYSQPQSYTPKFLADKILTTRSSIEGERKLVTVLFADVANYTAMSEKLDPEEVHQIMDGCFKILMDEIHKYEGTINQFTGDGVMALFGAPIAHEDHAQRACHAVLSIKKAIGAYGDKIKEGRGVDFLMRIGLNSGPVIVGSIGDDLRMDYTAVGDTTNLASRMESMAGPGTVLISSNTHRLARDFFEFGPLGKLEVKGKEEPVEAYELIKPSEIETRIEAAAAKGLTRFVGRKNSMAALMEPYEQAKAGSGRVVGIVGEAGVGKSRLLLEFRNRLSQDEFSYFEGRCLHYGGSMPYLPILDILRSYFEINEDDQEFVIKKKVEEKILRLDEKLKGVLAPLHDLLSLRVEDEEYLRLEPKVKRERTFEAVRDLLIRESQNRTLVVAAEDLHWIDKTSEEFLTYLIDWLANARILLLLLSRPEYTHQWSSKSFYIHIGLTQLTTQSSAELVQTILEGGEVVPELRELILNQTTGNPLFMEEFTHTLLENGSIQRKDNQYILSRKASEIQVPETIQGIIAARMDRLEENLKRTLQVASVIGRDFAFRILQAITGMREELKSHLLNLQGLEFIYEKQLFPELEYIFKHALTQEVAYNSLLLKRRKEIHENTGKAIEEIYSNRSEEFYEMLAYHYSKSDNLDKAYQYLKLSGEKAANNYSNWEAISFYKEAINVIDQLPKAEENNKAQIEVRLLMAKNQVFLGYPEGSLNILQDGERFAEEIGDKRSLALFCYHISQLYTYKGDALQGIQYAEKSFREATKIQDLDLMAPTAGVVCFALMRSGLYLKTVEIISKVIPLIEKTDRTSDSFGMPFNGYSMACGMFGLSSGLLGNFEKGISFFEKGLSNAREIRDLVTLGNVEMWYSIVLRVRGDGEQAIEHAQNAIKYYEEVDYPYGLGMAWSCLGYGYHLLGEYEEAQKQIEKGLKIQNDLGGVEAGISYYYIGLSMVHHDSGDMNKALSGAEKALGFSQKQNDRVAEGMSRICLGRIIGKKDLSQHMKVENSLLIAINIFDELNVKPYSAQGYLYLGKFYADTRRKDKANECLKKAESMFQEMGMDYWLARTYAVYADMHKKEGDQSRAKEQLEKAIGILRDLSADGWVKKYESELAQL